MIDKGNSLEGLAMRSSEAATGTRSRMPACSISTTTGPTTPTTTSASADPRTNNLDAGHAHGRQILGREIPGATAPKARQQAQPGTVAGATAAATERGKPLAYYNEIDPKAAQWLRNLIAAGHIAPGYVDERSIEDVLPSDLHGFTQCHFFAGIGVWSYALRQAGWPDDRPVWTGSCPCQPFSAAGQGAAFADERHLWPAFHHLIKERRPVVVFGEQVASKDADAWIDLVQDDMEGVGYALGAVPFPSSGIGAPHIRDRLYWVADDIGTGLEKRIGYAGVLGRATRASKRKAPIGSSLHDVGGVANVHGSGFSSRSEGFQALGYGPAAKSDSSFIKVGEIERAGPTNGYWRDADWLFCRDGKWRPVEPGTFPLADGAAARVVRLSAYGNAINAQAAQAFIESFMECRP